MFEEPIAATDDRDRFSMHRFITDGVGHLLGSYAAFGAVYVIDNVSHTPSTFNHLYPLSLAAALILADFICARKLGNTKWFGLASLVAATVAGYVAFFVFLEAFSFVAGGSNQTDTYFFVGWLLMSPIFLIPTFIVPLIIRLIAWPIVAHIRPER